MFKNRIQVQSPSSGCWLKIDTKNGCILGFKMSGKPWKSVRKHKKGTIKLDTKPKVRYNEI